MPVPSGPHSHFCPAPAYASQPSACTSTAIAPTPCAPSSSTGTSTSASSRGASLPLIQPTCGQAIRRVAGPISSAIRASGTSRTDSPRSSRAADSAPSSPGCSSSLVRISSSGPSGNPALVWAIASLVQLVRATSSGSHPSRAAYARRSSPPSSLRRSKCARLRPSRASRASSSAAASAARAGSGPSVPAFRYATLPSTGNSARSAEKSTNRENSPMTSTRPQRPLWEPSEEQLQRSEMARFMGSAGERRGLAFADYEELWRWSVGELEDFWATIWEFCGVRASRPYVQVLDSQRMPGARWFSGAELNYAENLLGGAARADAAALAERDARVAVVHASELRGDGQLTWGELRAQVAAVAGGLRALGVGRGDRVVAYMPNIPETLIAFLATASIGAIWSSAAPEFGARSVIDRFAQIEPTVLLAVDGYRHGGKDFDRREVVRGILAELPTVEHAVVLPYLDAAAGAGQQLNGALGWDELRRRGAGAELRFEQVPFDHPLWVLYSSGTTGLPKAIVHGHGGILLEQLKKRLHLDLRPGDRMFWFTTTGWMMWNFLVGCLLSDAAIVLYDGSPGHPDLGVLFKLAERAGITCLGVSAGLLSSCEKAGIEPARDHDLHALRAIGSTGSPLAPESFKWVYGHVGSGVWLFSTSGGTDVCTAFVGGCPMLPVYEGELQCRALGCAVESWDERGNSLIDQVGELVVTKPLPSMPLFLWGDADGT